MIAPEADGALAELDEDIEVVRRLAGSAPADQPGDAQLASLRGGVDQLLAQERGVLASLRQRPTWQRLSMVVAATAVVLVSTFALKPRSDLASYPAAHLSATLTLLGLLTVAASWRLLRPLHRAPLPAWTGRALLVAGVLAPMALALVPLDYQGAAAGEGMAFAIGCGRCMGFGAALSAPVLLLAMAARRARLDGAAVAALAGVVAGLTGYLALQLQCPVSEPLHVIAGHGMLVVLLAVVASLWS